MHASRGHDAIAAAGVLPVFTGVAVHDGYTPYRRYGSAHGLCNAHHLRELAAIIDSDTTQTWAADLARLLCEINDTVRHAHTVGAHRLDERLLDVYRHRYQTIIDIGKAANPNPIGHGARTAAANLLARLGGFWRDVLRFAYDLRVPFDNNLAERDIRMVKLRQKISGCLRTFTGAATVLRHPQLPLHCPQTRRQRPRRPHLTPPRSNLDAPNHVNSCGNPAA